MLASRHRASLRLLAPFAASLVVALAAAPPMQAQDDTGSSRSENVESTVITGETAQGPPNPAQEARMRLSSANRWVAQGEKLAAKEAKATDAKKKEELRGKAKSSYEAAIADYQAALKLDPKLVEAYVGLAGLMIKSGRIEQAIQTAEKALEIDPQSVKALVAKGEAQLAGFKISDAKATYDRLAAASAKAAKSYLSEMRTWLEAQRAKLGPELAAAVAELDSWIRERETK